jgi:uncharacterized protein DUF5655
MPGHECYHCKQWVDAGEAHDCWTTTEKALTEGLSDDLREAWARLREAAAELGEQRIYASHNSIMFARKTCYAFVRPKRSFLELVIFLGRTVRAPQVRRAEASSKTKVYHVVPIRHRDEVEAPITDWLAEAYGLQDLPATAATAKRRPAPRRKQPSRPRLKRRPA